MRWHAMISPWADARPAQPRMRDIEAIDSELRSVAAVRHVARERGWALRLPDVVDALLDERLRADRSGLQPAAEFLNL